MNRRAFLQRVGGTAVAGMALTPQADRRTASVGDTFANENDLPTHGDFHVDVDYGSHFIVERVDGDKVWIRMK